MIISPVESALKTKLAATVSDWPIRWPNENFTVAVGPGGLPIDTNGNPAPFLDAEVIGGPDTAAIAPVGSRQSVASGLFRVYLSVAQGGGLTAISAKADAITAALKRQTIYADAGTGRRLITMDPRIDDGVAAYEDENRFVRMISTPWIFDYWS